MLKSYAALVAALLVQQGHAWRQDIPNDDRDLMRFVSRPDLQPPKFDIHIYEPAAVTPGYWFVAPYVDLRTRIPSTVYTTGQCGPHIYDSRGELVWSGAHLFDDRTTFDFKVSRINDSDHLSFIVNEDLRSNAFAGGAGLILNEGYVQQEGFRNNAGRGTMNMHEFNVINNGKSALMITFTSTLVDLAGEGGIDKEGWIGNNGFQEVDLATGKTIFEWWALDHMHPFESMVSRPAFPGSFSYPWDFFHMNSVDKNEDGDYLISARFTNTVYKISGKDGHIIWRLGGKKSDFQLDGFNFSSQHDARFLSDKGSKTVITFLNNAADGTTVTSDYSYGLMLELDTRAGRATQLHRFDRPGRRLSLLRGNVQILPNKNVFVGWSDNSAMSEYTPDGKLVMDAEFESHRFVTYRSYKFNFTAKPTEAPRLKMFVYGTSPDTATTVYYVSWNGATEVARWRFYSSDNKKDGFESLGEVDKTTFETMFMTSGYAPWGYAEALDVDGNIIGKTWAMETQIPPLWEANGSGNGLAGGTASHHRPSSHDDDDDDKPVEEDYEKEPQPSHVPAASSPSYQSDAYIVNDDTDLHKDYNETIQTIADKYTGGNKTYAIVGALGSGLLFALGLCCLYVCVRRCRKRRAWMPKYEKLDS